jgi:hypothetical protein
LRKIVGKEFGWSGIVLLGRLAVNDAKTSS